MNKKIILLITALFVSVFIVIFFLSLIIRDRDSEQIRTDSPTQMPSPTPQQNELVVMSVLPQDKDKSYYPFQKITITFNDPVVPESLAVETQPNTEIGVFQGIKPTELFIVPSTTWSLGETRVTILQSTVSTSGKFLTSPYSYSILTALPTLSPEELQHDHP